MNISRLDIVSTILGDAPRRVRDLVRSRIRTDGRTAEAYRELDAVVTHARRVSSELKRKEERSIRNTLCALASDRAQGKYEQFAPSPSFKIHWALGRSVAAAATFFVTVGIFLFAVNWTSPTQERAAASSDAVGQDVAQGEIGSGAEGVRLSVVAPGASEALALYAEYATLREGISATEAGATVRIESSVTNGGLLLDRPMRLLAVGGTVRIGVS